MANDDRQLSLEPKENPSASATHLSAPASHAIGEFKRILAHIGEMDDVDVALVCQMMSDFRKSFTESIDECVFHTKHELKRRMLARGARAVPSPHFKRIEIEDVYTPYTYNVDKLREAKALLSEDDGNKLVTFVPERTEVIPAHWEPGNPNSIKAIVKKFGLDADGNATSEVGKLIQAGMHHQKTDEKLVIEPLVKAVPSKEKTA